MDNRKKSGKLISTDKELVFQYGEKEKCAAELAIAKSELGFQKGEKRKLAAELIIANRELAFQNDEKEKRSEELGIANKELAFQNDEKEKRAAELIIANKELVFQNGEKEKRAAELIIANDELVFQNGVKVKRAAELGIANKEIAFQNIVKGKRTVELALSLAFNQEAQEALAKSEENLRAVFENTSEGFILTDTSGIVKSLNNKAKEAGLLNAEEKIGIGKNIFDFIHESRKENYINFFSKVLRGETIQNDHSYVSKNGEPQWFSFTLNPVYAKGEIKCVCITVADITNRKQSEISLSQSEFRYRQMIETMQVGIWAIDEYAKTDFVNKKMCEILGYLPEEMMGKPLFDFIDGEEKEIANDILAKMSNKCIQNFEFKFISKSGDTIWTQITTNPILGMNETYKGSLAMVSDVTEKKLADKLLQENEQKYRLLASQLELKNKDLRQFAYIVSHNLRAPVAKIQGLAFLINHDIDSHAMIPELLQTMAKEVEQLDTVIKDMNGILSVQDTGNKKMEFVLFAENLELIKHVLENQIKVSKAVFITDFHKLEGLVTVKSYFYSILYNLLSNAIKYRSPERQLVIQLNTTRHENLVRLSVKDNGRGINLEKNGEKMFALYKRFHGNKIEGRGIGLNLVKTQAESLGGRAEVISTENMGTEFLIYLPMNKQSNEDN